MQQPEPQSEKKTPIEFVKEKLGLNPEASFAEIKAMGKVEGLTVYPVVYGRAKALLGLVPTAPYGSKSKARRIARASRETAEEAEDRPLLARARTARPRSNGNRAVKGSKDPLSSLENLVSDLKSTVHERDRLRATLEKVVEILQAELSR